MYNCSRGVAAGYVKRIDWKAIENANMATMGFKEQLLQTAEKAGTVKKQADGMYKVLSENNKGKTMKDSISATKNFNDSLSYQWMTTEVLTKTLEHYSTDVRDMTKEEVKAYEAKLKKQGYTEKEIKDLEELGKKAFDAAKDVKTFSQLIDTLKESVGSGWAQTFQIIFGDLDEAKKLWTGIYSWAQNVIDISSDARNNLLQAWKDGGGRNTMLETITLIGDMIMEAGTNISKVLKNILPKITGKDLVNATTSLYNGIKKINDFLFTENRDKSSVFDVVSKGIGAIISTIKVPLNFLKSFLSFINDIWKAIKPDSSDISAAITVFEKLFDSIIAFNKAFTPNWFTEKLFIPIENVLGITKNTIQALVPELANLKKGISKALNGMAKAINTVSDKITSFRKTLSDFWSDLTSWLSDMRKSSAELKKTSKETESSTSVFKKLVKSIKTVWDTIKPLVNGILTIITGVFSNIKNYLKNQEISQVIENLSDAIINVMKVLSAGAITKTIMVFSKNIEKFAGGIGDLGTSISDIAKMPEKFSKALSSMQETVENYDESTVDKLTALALAILGIAVSLTLISTVDTKAIGKVMGAFAGAITMFIGAFFAISKISGNMGSIKLSPIKSIGDFFDNVMTIWKANTNINTVLKLMIGVAVSMTLLAAALKTLSKIPNDRIASSIGLFTAIISELVGAVALMVKISKTANASKLNGVMASMLILTAAISSLIPFFDLLGLLSIDRAGIAILAFSAILWELVGAVSVLLTVGKKTHASDALGATTAILILTTAISSLIPFFDLLGVLPLSKAGTAIGLFSAILWELVGAISVLSTISKKSSMGDLTGISINFIMLTTALSSLMPFFDLLGALTAKRAGVALVAFSAILWELVGAMAVMAIIGQKSYASDMASVTACFVLMTVSIESLLPLLSLLAVVSKDRSIQMIESFSSIVFALAIGLAAMSMIGEVTDTSSLAKVTGCLLIFTTALNSLLPIISLLSVISEGAAAQAINSFIGIVMSLVGAIFALTMIGNMSESNGVLAVSASLVIFATAISILTPALIALGMVPFDNLAKGLTVIGISILMFAAAVTYLSSFGPALLTVSASFLAFGAATLLLGAGITAIGVGLQAIGVGITALIASLPAGITAILALIPAFVGIFWAAIVEFKKGLTKYKKTIVDTFIVLLDAVADAIIAFLKDAGKVIDAIFAFVNKVLTSLDKNITPWVKKIVSILLKIFDGINAKTSEFVKRLIIFSIYLINGFAKGIEENKEKIKAAFLNLLKSIWDLMCEFFGVHSPSTKMADYGKNLLLGLINGIKDKEKLKSSILKLLKSIWDLMCEFFGIHSPSTKMAGYGKNLLLGLTKGIKNNVKLVIGEIKELLANMKSKFTSKISEFTSIGQNIIDGINNGITVKKNALIKKLQKVANLIPDTVKKLLGIKSPSRVMAKLGNYIMAGLSVGINQESRNTLMTMRDSIQMLTDIASSDIESSPVITPVLDMSGVRSGANAINGLFGGAMITANANVGAINTQLSRNQNRSANDNIVAAIDKLGRTIEDNPKTVNTINGLNYSDNSDINDAVETLIDAIIVGRRS